MMFNRRSVWAVAGAAISGFPAKLEYECAWYEAEYVKGDR